MKKNKKSWFVLCSSILPFIASAQEQSVYTQTYFSNALFNTLLIVIIVLIIVIVALGQALKNIAQSDLYKNKKNNETQNNSGVKNLSLVGFMLLAISANAENQNFNQWYVGGLEQPVFFLMLSVILIEAIIVFSLYRTFMYLIRNDEQVKKVVKKDEVKTKTILDTINASVDIEKEQDILLEHDYDGIKELDNNLPPWWKYGFYLTILIALIYLVNFHITKTSPLQKQEYINNVKKAEAEIVEYMKNSADNVDETTVKMLNEPADLSNGKDLFVSNCAACHGRLGEGGVGPNLTDEYWLHGGSMKDIFKTIKYGWSDKGMKAWKEDFSPVQIAQISSYVHTLTGTNPPKAKEKQGELYVEPSDIPSDSSAVKIDSTKTVAAELPK